MNLPCCTETCARSFKCPVHDRYAYGYRWQECGRLVWCRTGAMHSEAQWYGTVCHCTACNAKRAEIDATPADSYEQERDAEVEAMVRNRAELMYA